MHGLKGAKSFPPLFHDMRSLVLGFRRLSLFLSPEVPVMVVYVPRSNQ